jgi:hypothetical protein
MKFTNSLLIVYDRSVLDLFLELLRTPLKASRGWSYSFHGNCHILHTTLESTLCMV